MSASESSPRLYSLLLPAALLLLACFVFVEGLQNTALTMEEGRTAWLVGRLPATDAGTLAALRAAAGDLLQAVERDAGSAPLYAGLLSLWTLLAGHEAAALRLPSVLAGLVALAAAYALGARLSGRGAGLAAAGLLLAAALLTQVPVMAGPASLALALGLLLVLTFVRWRARPSLKGGLLPLLLALLLLASGPAALLSVGVRPPRVDWTALAAEAAAARPPLEPALLHVPPQHPLLYHAPRAGLLHGIVVETGWRPHSAGELTEIAERLRGVPSLWLYLDPVLPGAQALLDALSAGRVVVSQTAAGDLLFYHLQNSPDG